MKIDNIKYFLQNMKLIGNETLGKTWIIFQCLPVMAVLCLYLFIKSMYVSFFLTSIECLFILALWFIRPSAQKRAWLFLTYFSTAVPITLFATVTKSIDYKIRIIMISLFFAIAMVNFIITQGRIKKGYYQHVVKNDTKIKGRIKKPLLLTGSSLILSGSIYSFARVFTKTAPDSLIKQVSLFGTLFYMLIASFAVGDLILALYYSYRYTFD